MRRRLSCRCLIQFLVILSLASLISLFTCNWKTLANHYLDNDPALQEKLKYIPEIKDYSKPLITAQDIGAIKGNDRCFVYMTEAMMQRYVYYNVFNATGRSPVCLLTQFTMDRLDMFTSLVHHWNGTISAVLYVENRDYVKAVKLLEEKIKETGKESLVYIHTVLKYGKYYPINYLRNVAQNGSRKVCDFILQTDVDFMPSTNLYGALMQQINASFFHRDKPIALVVPAFEYKHQHLNTSHGKLTFLNSKQEVLRSWAEGKVIPYHVKPKSEEGHFATNFKKWKTYNTDHPYKVTYRVGFEPYALLPQAQAPPYISLFLQRYGNKVSYFVELDARGFEFRVLPTEFMVHLPHISLDSKALFREVGPCTSMVYRTLLKKAKKIKSMI